MCRLRWAEQHASSFICHIDTRRIGKGGKGSQSGCTISSQQSETHYALLDEKAKQVNANYHFRHGSGLLVYKTLQLTPISSSFLPYSLFFFSFTSQNKSPMALTCTDICKFILGTWRFFAPKAWKKDDPSSAFHSHMISAVILPPLGVFAEKGKLTYTL